MFDRIRQSRSRLAALAARGTVVAGLATGLPLAAQPLSLEVTAEIRPALVEVYDFAEVTLRVEPPLGGNPFVDVEVTGMLVSSGGPPRTVPGFCDSDDGSVFRVRFMPRRPGVHVYTIRLSAPNRDTEWSGAGTFRAVAAGRKGPVRVDPDHPHHFVWEGTGEHFFYTGATAYHLLSWTDENRMLSHFERIADAGANRVRFLNYGRASDDEWSEGMVQGSDFVWTLAPWPAVHPTRQLRDGSMGPDHRRFNLAHWRKAETLLRAMRERDVIAAVNFYMDRGISAEHGADDAPAAFSEDELRYFRYGVARYGAFSNVMWDLGTEHDEYRTAAWATVLGGAIRAWDPYDRLVSAHPNEFRPSYLSQPWYDFAEFQYYGVEADGFGPSLLERANRQIRYWREHTRAAGRPIPQVNEEYGYELDPNGFYEPLRQVHRKAWAIVMGGGYVTSGEKKAWQHGDPTNGGRVEPETRILRSTTLMRRFFEEREIPYWKMEPWTALDGTGAFGLALPGQHYVAYLPDGGSIVLPLAPGRYAAEWFHPATGVAVPIPGAARGNWRSPGSPPPPPGDSEDTDWVLHVHRHPLDRFVDFGPPGSVPEVDAERDAGVPFDSTVGRGWLGASGPVPSRGRSCPGAQPSQASFVFSASARTWEMDLENGDYEVAASVGDCQFPQGPQHVSVEGLVLVDGESTAAGSFVSRTRRVRVLDGRLTVTIGGGAGNTTLNALEVRRALRQPATLRSIAFLAHGASAPAGFTADHGAPFASAEGRGWSRDLRVNARTRGHDANRALDGLVFVTGPAASFEAAVPDGAYDVEVAVGDIHAQGPHRVVVEGVTVVADETTAAGAHFSRRARVFVSDGRLTMEVGGTLGNTAVNYLTVASAPAERLRVNFQPEGSVAPIGYSPDWGAPYTAARRYGWLAAQTGRTRDRGRAADRRLDTLLFVAAPAQAWEADLPFGDYEVTVAVGDPLYAQGPHWVSVEGLSLFAGETTAAGASRVKKIRVPVRDGRLTLGVGGGASGLTVIQSVEAEATPSLAAVNFQPAGAPAPRGFAPDAGAVYEAARGYGWTTDMSTHARARGLEADEALDTFIFAGASPATWQLDLPEGSYHVGVAIGDAAFSQGPQRVEVEGELFFDGEITAVGQYLRRSRCVRVGDGRLTVRIGGLAGNTALDWVRVVASPCTPR